MAKLIRYTNDKTLPVCPRCGKHGLERPYKGGSKAFHHTGERIYIRGIGGGVRILEYCFIKAEVAK